MRDGDAAACAAALSVVNALLVERHAADGGQ